MRREEGEARSGQLGGSRGEHWGHVGGKERQHGQTLIVSALEASKLRISSTPDHGLHSFARAVTPLRCYFQFAWLTWFWHPNSSCVCLK